MPEARTPSRPEADDLNATLRRLGARAHQLRAATRAADHFNARGTPADRNTGSWLMSSALAQAEDLAGDIDSLARGLKERPAEAALQQAVSALRVRVHQLHAAARAADHFLDQDGTEDQETGGWLVATAFDLANKLAAEIDDAGGRARRPQAAERVGVSVDVAEVAPVRRVAG